MFKYLVYTAFGWLVFSGVMHFCVDVVSQHLRGKRIPGAETTLYYGLNSAFALGQVAFGALGLYVALRSLDMVRELPVLAFALLLGLGWLAISYLFMEYMEPRFIIGLFCLLIVAAIVAR